MLGGWVRWRLGGRCSAGLFEHPLVKTICHFGAFAIFTVLSGCGFITFVHVTVNDPITPEEVAFIIPGQTTFAEIIERLGTPDELTGTDNQAVISYHFRDVAYSRVNFGWPLRFWTPVQPDMIFSTAGLGTNVFQVTFTQSWVVQEHAFAQPVERGRYIPWPFHKR
jgi:hypothetical protein